MKEAISGTPIKNIEPNIVRENHESSFPQEGVICDFTQQFPPMLTTELQESDSGGLRIAISDGSNVGIPPETQKILRDFNMSLSTLETEVWSSFNKRNKNNFIKFI